VWEERQSVPLVEGDRLTGITGNFCAVIRQRRSPNPLLAEVMAR
jgi:hypothetical protein